MNLENRDYEKALLGCILLDNQVLDEYNISSKMFSWPFAQDVFASIEKAVARGVLVDSREIALCMPPKHAGDIMTLTDVPSTANVKFYVDELKELSRRRGLSRLAREVSALAVDASTSGEIFDHIDAAITEISGSRDVGYQHIAHYLKQATSEIEYACANKGKLSGVPTGFPGLDQKTNGWQPQTMNVIGARPGSGKTSIALNMASAAIRGGYAAGFFSAEMSGVALAKRVYADWAAVDFGKLQSGFLVQGDIGAIGEAAQQLVASKFFLNDKPSISLRDLIADSRKMVRKEDVKIIFIDYLSLIGNEKQGLARHEQVAEISKSLLALSRELNIPIVVLSQLTREAQGERPKLSQLRDSGSVEQDAHMVMLLHNMGYSDDTKTMVKINLIVEKNRNGATGDIPMMFRPARMRFTEVEEAWQVPEKKREYKRD